MSPLTNRIHAHFLFWPLRGALSGHNNEPFVYLDSLFDPKQVAKRAHTSISKWPPETALLICALQYIFCALWFLHWRTILHIICALFSHPVRINKGLWKQLKVLTASYSSSLRSIEHCWTANFTFRKFHCEKMVPTLHYAWKNVTNTSHISYQDFGFCGICARS